MYVLNMIYSTHWFEWALGRGVRAPTGSASVGSNATRPRSAPCPLSTASPPQTRSCLAQPEHVRGQVLEAFGCWLRLSCGQGLPENFESHPLVSAATAGLRSEGTFHQAVDAVRDLI